MKRAWKVNRIQFPGKSNTLSIPGRKYLKLMGKNIRCRRPCFPGIIRRSRNGELKIQRSKIKDQIFKKINKQQFVSEFFIHNLKNCFYWYNYIKKLQPVNHKTAII